MSAKILDELKSTHVKLQSECNELNSQIHAIRQVLGRYRLTCTTAKVHERQLPIMDSYREEYSKYSFPIRKMFTKPSRLNAGDAILEIRKILRK